jgi:Rps23 Pro-64 3,4-dihydroxylase Tpa1-like proline 4-hydroxylase
MKVCRPEFRAPTLIIDGFLAEEEASMILQECLDLRKVYMPGMVFNARDSTTIDPRYRSNEVVYLDEIFRSAPERSKILTIIGRKLWTDECRALWHEGYYIFDVINYCTRHEAVVSRYDDNQLYRRHQDTRWDNITFRLVSMIYYVNREPQQFSGGALVLWHDNEPLKIEAKHNRAVVFPSFVGHEVEPVHMKSNVWEDARFSINYWMGFR